VDGTADATIGAQPHAAPRTKSRGSLAARFSPRPATAAARHSLWAAGQRDGAAAAHLR